MLTVHRPRDEITAWYAGGTASPGSAAVDVYSRAVKYFEKELAERPSEREWIRGQTSLEDVKLTVESARKAYDLRSEHHAAAKRWIDAFAETVNNYGTVLDVLAAADPLHAGLAWGAIKFVFAGVANYSQHAAELAKALTRIGEVLPRIRIELALYNTAHMSAAIVQTYAHILLFLQRAVTWYNMNRTKRIVKTIFSPSQLSFKDTVAEIESCTKNVEMIANTAGRAEIRDQSLALAEQAGRQRLTEQRLMHMQDQLEHLQVSSVQGDQLLQRLMQYAMNHDDLLTSIKLNSSLPSASMLALPNPQILRALQSGRMPEDMLKTRQSIARRRPSWFQNDRATAITIRQLQQWAQLPGCSMIIVRPGPRATQRVQDMATEMTVLLRSTSYPTFYYLATPARTERAPTVSDILKSLIFQALRHDPSISSQDPRLGNITSYECSHDLVEWKDLASLVLSKVGRCFVLIAVEDLHLDARNSVKTPSQLLSIMALVFEEAASKGATIKMLVVANTKGLPPPVHASSGSHTVVTMGAPVPASRRSLVSRRPNASMGRASCIVQPRRIRLTAS